jgi:transcriptional regulator with XRE-family HTH domain
MTDERSATEVDRRLGQRVRARRIELGVSQEKLAELLGVTFQQVQKYEKGINRVAASRLYELAVALEVPVGYFFEGLARSSSPSVQEPRPDEAVFEALATPEGFQLLTLFNNVRNPKVRRRIVELVRVMAADHEADSADGDGA